MNETNTSSTIVIIGTGQAGGSCATELRKRGFEGRIVLVGDEPHIPYKRPPLSKAYLAGDTSLESLYVMHAPKLEENNIETQCGVAVDKIDRDNQQVILADGNKIDYDKLVLATGGRARPLPVDGADADNVFLLRTIADVEQIKQHCTSDKRVAIVGGGFIGLEAAAISTKLGLDVTVLEGFDRVLSRVTSPDVSAFFERIHREAGVNLRTGVSVTAIEHGNNGSEIVLDDGERVATDFVIVGIGLIPNTELASDAGLEVDNGIVVNEHTQTSDPDIYAAGDCTSHPNSLFGNIRLESVQNAMDQGRATAHNLIGTDKAYDTVPWFWSDQYDVKLQMAGISSGYDDYVIRGNPDDHQFSVFYLKNGQLISTDAINRAKDFMMAKKLIGAQAQPDREQLADDDVPLKSLLPES